MIPRVAHCYWGQDDLPFLRFLTIWSFAALNPDWQIVLHEPEIPDGLLRRTWQTHEHRGTGRSNRNYRPWLRAVPNLTFVRHGAGRYAPALTHVHRSDLLRWELLATEGGVWMDMDIVWVRPMSDVPAMDAEAFVCVGSGTSWKAHLIGMLGSAPGAWPYTEAWALAQAHAVPDATSDYQTLGSHLLARVCPLAEPLPPGVVNLPEHTVYPVSWAGIRWWIPVGDVGALDERTVGVHWFAGDPLATNYAMRVVHDDCVVPGGAGMLGLASDVMARYPLPALLSDTEIGILSESPVPLSSPSTDGR